MMVEARIEHCEQRIAELEDLITVRSLNSEAYSTAARLELDAVALLQQQRAAIGAEIDLLRASTLDSMRSIRGMLPAAAQDSENAVESAPVRRAG